MTFPVEEAKETITYRRKKSKGRRQKIFDDFIPEEKHHTLEGEGLYCSDCHSLLKEIGASCARQELVFIPAQLKRIDHIQHSYKCEKCSQENASDRIIKAPVSKAPLAHSLGSASIIAHTIYQKYVLKVPAYRQENDWKQIGLPITRKEITNWQIKVCDYYLQSIYDLLKQKLIKQDILHADETPYNVIESDSSKTYYWTFLSGKHNEQGITLYHHGSRKGQEAIDFLNGFKGYLHCDQYQAYKMLDNVTLVGCWAHLRRKFVDASPNSPDNESIAQKAIAFVDQMFRLERSFEHLSTKERFEERQKQLKPMIDSFFTWCHKHQSKVLKNSKLGTAFAYSLGHEEAFRNVLKDGNLVLSNNMAERSIKSIVMGRKNWLFSTSYHGAKSVAIIMSILETAKRHKLNTEKYLTYLLEKLPNKESLADLTQLEAFLPWSKEVQANCR